MSCDVSTFDIVLLNMLSFMGGIFGGMFAGIKLRNTMLKSRSRDNLSNLSHHTMTSNQPHIHGSPLANGGGFSSQIHPSAPPNAPPNAPPSAPPIAPPIALANSVDTHKQEIVIRTSD